MEEDVSIEVQGEPQTVTVVGVDLIEEVIASRLLPDSVKTKPPPTEPWIGLTEASVTS